MAGEYKVSYVSDIILNNNELLKARLENIATHPNDSLRGYIYFNTKDLTAYIKKDSNTWIDIGSKYIHPDYESDSITIDSTKVIDKIVIENGHIVDLTQRVLYPSDIGASNRIHEHKYSDIEGVPSFSFLMNNTQYQANVQAIPIIDVFSMIKTNLFTKSHTVNELEIGIDRGNGVILREVTDKLIGLMSPSSLKKLGTIEEGANKYIHPKDGTFNNPLAIAKTNGLDIISQLIVNESGHTTNITLRKLSNADIKPIFLNDATKSTNFSYSSSKIEDMMKKLLDEAKTGALQYMGEYNPVTNVPDILNDTSVKIGHTYVIDADGSFLGEEMEKGDMIISKVDNPGKTLANWQTVNKNIPSILDATELVKGIVKLATSVEGKDKNNNKVAVTPKVLHTELETKRSSETVIMDITTKNTEYSFQHTLGNAVSAYVRRKSDGKRIGVGIITKNNIVEVKVFKALEPNQYEIIIKR